MAERTLANPTIEVNNGVIGIKPNSLTFKSGKGDKKVRPQSAGGNSVEMVITEDAETKKGMVKFTLYNTKTNVDLLTAWQDSVEGNTVRFSDGEFVRSFRTMTVTSDPDISLGADGEFEAVFEGQPAG